MRATILLLSILGMLSATDQLTAEEHRFGDKLRGHSDLCFAETLKINNQKEKPSTGPCEKALRDREFKSRDQRSIDYHNLGIIQTALEQYELAFQSFQHSVALSESIDMRNVALAQAASKVHDQATACHQYKLLSLGSSDNFQPEVLDVLSRNHERLAKTCEQTALAAEHANAPATELSGLAATQ